MEHYQTDPFADLESQIGVGQGEQEGRSVSRIQPNWARDSFGIRGPQKPLVRPMAIPEPIEIELGQESQKRVPEQGVAACPCPNTDVETLNTITVTGEFSGFYLAGVRFCCGTSQTNTGSRTETWTRIPFANTFTGAQEFKLWFDENCNLQILVNGSSPPFTIPSSVGGCEDFVGSMSGASFGITNLGNGTGYWGAAGSVSANACAFLNCNVNFGNTTIETGAVDFTCDEVPGFTISGTFTCDCVPATDCSSTVTGEITIS